MKKFMVSLFAVMNIALLTSCGETTSTPTTEIGEAKAHEIALAHAEKDEMDVTYIISETDIDDGRTVYDVEFYVGNTEYDYEIDMYTGEIVSFDSDIENYAANTNLPAPAQSADTNAPTTNTMIDEAKAKAIALAHAEKSETEVTFKPVNLETEDTIKVYDVEFNIGKTEYTYEIDATTGDIREYDVDND